MWINYRGSSNKLVQWHTVLLRPCKRDKYKLPDGYVVLEQVGLYLPPL